MKKINLDDAKIIVEEAKRQRQEEFTHKYKALCNQYGYELEGKPIISNNGRIVVALYVVEK